MDHTPPGARVANFLPLRERKLSLLWAIFMAMTVQLDGAPWNQIQASVTACEMAASLGVLLISARKPLVM